MIFWKYKWFTMDKLLILNTTVFYLISVFIILIRICFLNFFKVEFKLNNGTFQKINHLKNSAIPLKIAFENIDKKQLPYPVIHIIYLFIFHFDFKDAIKYIQQYYPSFYTFYESHFSRVRHPSHPGRGHGSLTCHMTQFGRSDWLRSENFINIMKE